MYQAHLSLVIIQELVQFHHDLEHVEATASHLLIPPPFRQYIFYGRRRLSLSSIIDASCLIMPVMTWPADIKYKKEE